MSTNSTKRQRRKNNNALESIEKANSSSISGPVGAKLPEMVGSNFEGHISQRAWLILCLTILAVAAILRVYALELKPMHHDEGVNGFFLMNLVRNGAYRYDPSNYHGPTLYYLSLPSVTLFGLNTIALRLVTAFFGIANVGLILLLRRYVGTIGVLSAAALVAVSPGAVYYSRYFIHEELFVFFTLAVVVALLRFHETLKVLYLMLAAASAALLFATKETAFVSIGTLGLAWIVARWWVPAKGGRSTNGPSARMRRSSSYERTPAWMSVFGGRERTIGLLLAAIILFVFLNILFYSSFFSNWAGVSGAIESLKVWSKTGASDFHAKPFGTYLGWLGQEEAPIFLLAIVGALIALFEISKNRFVVFAGAWAFGMLAAYSLIPYKTPWLMLSFVVPMAIVAGYAIQELGQWLARNWNLPAGGVIVAVLALAIGAYQCLVLNFREYDNDKYPYVYTHTNREMLALIDKVQHLTEQSGKQQMAVSITSPEYWPLPWYFRDNPGVGYAGSVADHYDPQATPLVIGKESSEAKEDQAGKLRTMLGTDYKEVGVYTLRPGVRLALFARRDLEGG